MDELDDLELMLVAYAVVMTATPQDYHAHDAAYDALELLGAEHLIEPLLEMQLRAMDRRIEPVIYRDVKTGGF